MNNTQEGCNTLPLPPVARHVLASGQNVARMTSFEIAELTNKAHRNVLRDARTMLAELYGAGGVLSFEHTQRNPQNGQTYPYLLLGRREVEVLLTGYSVALRARVIDRLHELEDALAPGIPQSLPDALRLAADLAEQNARLNSALAEQAPKVEALARIAEAQGSMTLTDAAKHLGLKRGALIGWLSANRWIYQRSGCARWLAYQPRQQAGWLDHKVTVFGAEDDGTARIASQVRVTAKGLAVLALRVKGVC